MEEVSFLIERDCESQKLSMCFWLEERCWGGFTEGGKRGRQALASSPPSHLDSPPFFRSPTHHTPLITGHGKAGKTAFYDVEQEKDITMC